MPVIVQTAFNQISQSAGYKEDDVSVNLTVCGGSNGGVMPFPVRERRTNGSCNSGEKR